MVSEDGADGLGHAQTRPTSVPLNPKASRKGMAL